MAIAVDTTAKAAAKVNGASISWTHTLGVTADAIVVFFYVTALTNPASGHPNVTVDSVDCGAPQVNRTWTFGTDNNIFLYILTAPHTGSVTVQVSITDGLGLYGGSVSLIGVKQTTPVSHTASADDGGAGGSPATVNVSSASGELVIDGAYSKHGTGDMTANQTQQWQFPGDGTGQETWGQETAGGAASVTMSWALPGLVDTWGIVGMSITPASGGTVVTGAPSPPVLVIRLRQY